MTLADMIAAVYVETARPDLVSETQNALVASLLKWHSFDFFWKDIQTAQLEFEITNYIQVIDLQLLPRFRALAYARKYDPTLAASQNNPSILPPLTYPWYNSASVMGFLDIITPDDILDEFGVEKVDVMYGVGGALMLKSGTSVKYLQIGWYAQPIVDTSDNGIRFGNGSFIMQEYPWLLIYDAASKIFQTIGQNDASRKFDNPNPNAGGLVQQQLETLIRNNIQVKGY